MAASSAIRTLSLFSGAGGLDIGFQKSGFETVACVEIEPAYCKTLEANHGPGRPFKDSCRIHCADIREFDPHQYLGAGIECIIGGPPCQTFSAAGRRSGGVLGTSDARGRLFESYCRALSVIQPTSFIFENVYGLPGANGGGPWREICNAFSRLGYQLAAEVLDAADYGVPQHRERLIIVGTRRGFPTFRFPEPTHGPDSPSGQGLIGVLEAIADLQDPQEPYHELDGLYGHLLSQVPEGLNYSFFTQEMGYPLPRFAWRSKFHDFLYKVDPRSPSRTIKAQPGKFTGPFHWKNRHFSVNELKRLQSFPDDYQVVGSFGKTMEQIGNSVPPRLAEILATSVRQQILRPTRVLTYPVRQPGFKSTFRQRQRERTHHFKVIAAKEIANRYPKLTVLRANRTLKSEEYFVSYQSQFISTVRKTLDQKTLGEKTYLVSREQKGECVKLAVREVGERAKGTYKALIVIAGLRKYLLMTDKLECEAEIACSEDWFKVWDIIESALTKGSQFFTLIDIYGHYANRGDTVSVAVDFDKRRLSTLERAVQFFGSSHNCGIFIEDSLVANHLGIQEVQLPQIIANLRTLRWDIRTAETHATISQHGLICTYPFPILSGRAQFDRKVSESAR